VTDVVTTSSCVTKCCLCVAAVVSVELCCNAGSIDGVRRWASFTSDITMQLLQMLKPTGLPAAWSH